MTFQARRAQSLDILKRTGMWRSNYEPPILRVLWKIGIEIPPPHFLPFWQVLVLGAGWFAGAWGSIMWLGEWSKHGVSIMSAVGTASVAGVFFGIAMAIYYAHGRRKHRLPKWNAIDGILESK